MTSGVKVSIITVSFNSARTVERTIKSVLKQTYDNIEYILVDGASTDGTPDIAAKYIPLFEKAGKSFRIISEPDNGIYDAMNKGIRLASGELVGIINSDDWYEKTAVETVVSEYEKNGFDLCYGNLRIVRENPDGSFSPVMIKHARYRKNIAVSRDWNHPTMFVKRSVYDEYQYKCESIHDDWDLVLRLWRAGKKTHVINKTLADFRMGGVSNERNIKLSFERGRARYRIYRNNGYSRLYLLECIAIELVKFLF